MTLSFVRPEWLWLLLLVPGFWLVARWSRRPMSRGRWRVVLALRGLLVAAVVLALAEPEIRRRVDDLAVVFLVDASASIGSRGEQRALDYVRAAVEHQGAHDQAGVVLFGADAVIEQAPRERLEVNTFESRPSPHQTDIASGLRLGAALLPADRTRRLVLLTDGEETRGDAAEQALLTRDEDLDLLVVRLEGSDAPEVLLEDLLGPSEVEEGATFELKVVARADQDTKGVVRLYRNEAYLGERPVELSGGPSTVLAFRQVAGEPGLSRYRAVIEVDPSIDGRPENNRVLTTVLVAGRPKVLLVDRDPASAVHLATALRGEGLTDDEVQLLAEQLEGAVMDATLHGAYKLFFRLVFTPERYAHYSQPLWTRFYSSGRLESRVDGDIVTSRIVNWRGYHSFLCRMNREAARIIHMAMGRHVISTATTECRAAGDAACGFRLVLAPRRKE